MLNKIIQEIKEERIRQVEKEGYDPIHDDLHIDGSIANAAAHYAATEDALALSNGVFHSPLWKWDKRFDKKEKKSRRDQLKVAAALIVAEMERLDREAEQFINKCQTCRFFDDKKGVCDMCDEGVPYAIDNHGKTPNEVKKCDVYRLIGVPR